MYSPRLLSHCWKGFIRSSTVSALSLSAVIRRPIHHASKMDEYDDGDDLFADVNPDELIRANKRPADDSSSERPGSDSLGAHLLKRVKTNGTDLRQVNHVDLARNILREKFGYDSFRHEQEKAIEAVLRGDNTLVVFPTGAGKSLCYQVSLTTGVERGHSADIR